MYGEIVPRQGHVLPSCKPKYVSGSITEDTWRERAKEGTWFVVLDGTETVSNNTITVAFGATNDAEFVGRLVGTTGSGTDFIVSVETEGKNGNAISGGTGALAATDIGKFCKLDGNGKLVVDTALTAGNVVVTGGTKADLLVAWSWPVVK